MRDEQSTISALALLLESLGIEWALMGGLAANRYRVAPRLTNDADLLLVGLGGGEPALGAILRPCPETPLPWKPTSFASSVRVFARG